MASARDPVALISIARGDGGRDENLVSGATGNIGRMVVDHLLAAGPSASVP
jgi:hypothetical protein